MEYKMKTYRQIMREKYLAKQQTKNKKQRIGNDSDNVKQLKRTNSTINSKKKTTGGQTKLFNEMQKKVPLTKSTNGKIVVPNQKNEKLIKFNRPKRNLILNRTTESSGKPKKIVKLNGKLNAKFTRLEQLIKSNTELPHLDQNQHKKNDTAEPSGKPTKILKLDTKSPRLDQHISNNADFNIRIIKFSGTAAIGMRLDGLKVVEIASEKQAAKKGVQVGWVVNALNGEKVFDANVFRDKVVQFSKMENLIFTFLEPKNQDKSSSLPQNSSKNVKTSKPAVDNLKHPADDLIIDFKKQVGKELIAFHQEQPPINGDYKIIDAFIEDMETYIKKQLRSYEL